MLAALVRGLATCPQVSFVRHQTIIVEQLGHAPEEVVTCCMSCGYADEQAAVNRLNMPREPLDGFARWLGFDEQANLSRPRCPFLAPSGVTIGQPGVCFAGRCFDGAACVHQWLRTT